MQVGICLPPTEVRQGFVHSILPVNKIGPVGADVSSVLGEGLRPLLRQCVLSRGDHVNGMSLYFEPFRI